MFTLIFVYTHTHFYRVYAYTSYTGGSNGGGDTLRRPVILLEVLEGDTLSHHLSIKRPFHSRPFSKLRYVQVIGCGVGV